MRAAAHPAWLEGAGHALRKVACFVTEGEGLISWVPVTGRCLKRQARLSGLQSRQLAPVIGFDLAAVQLNNMLNFIGTGKIAWIVAL